MNAFVPFTKNNEHHEDHLTRGFLLLLKYSPAVFYSFYDYVQQEYSKLELGANPKPEMANLFTQDLDYQIETQKGCREASGYLNPNLLSILITDEALEIEKEVGSSNRQAVYDGIVKLEPDWTFIIENKPDHDKVWEDQLSPGKFLSEEINEKERYLVRKPVVLQWREIFNRLNYIKCSDIERLFIKDFQDFIFRTYPTLFPYETFKQCKKNINLLDFRIEKMLKEIVNESEQNCVQEQAGWAKKIKLNNEYINQVDYRATDKGLRLYLFYGISVHRSKNLFNFLKNSIDKKIDILPLKSEDSGWKPDFFIKIADAYGREIVTLCCKNAREQDFVKYWTENIGQIGQKNIDEEFRSFIENLKSQQFIDSDICTELNLGNRTKVSIMPAVSFQYDFSFADLYSLEKSKELEAKVVKITKEGLSVVDKANDFEKLIKDQYKEPIAAVR